MKALGQEIRACPKFKKHHAEGLLAKGRVDMNTGKKLQKWTYAYDEAYDQEAGEFGIAPLDR